MNALLFALTVVIWGSTWIAIAMQVGDVPLIVSVFYRFAMAAMIYIVVLALFKKLSFPNLKHHPYIAIQGLCLFSLNFVLLYNSAIYIPSGLIAVIFSLSTIFNAINARIFFGESISRRVIFAGFLGLLGLVFIFVPDFLQKMNSEVLLSDTLSGISLAAVGTLLFSIGNMVSRRNSLHGLSTPITSAWGMSYGAIIMMAIIFTTSTPIIAPPDFSYIVALLYLAVFGSVVGFTAYLMLITRIGSSRAAYATVLFPVIAIALSFLFEGYEIRLTTIVGVFLTIVGNIIMFWKIKIKKDISI